MKKNTKKSAKVAKPFGLEMLTEVDQAEVNGGSAAGGKGVFKTMGISMPTKHRHHYDYF
jgi:hypothetical protein